MTSIQVPQWTLVLLCVRQADLATHSAASTPTGVSLLGANACVTRAPTNATSEKFAPTILRSRPMVVLWILALAYPFMVQLQRLHPLQLQ